MIEVFSPEQLARATFPGIQHGTRISPHRISMRTDGELVLRGRVIVPLILGLFGAGLLFLSFVMLIAMSKSSESPGRALKAAILYGVFGFGCLLAFLVNTTVRVSARDRTIRVSSLVKRRHYRATDLDAIRVVVNCQQTDKCNSSMSLRQNSRDISTFAESVLDPEARAASLIEFAGWVARTLNLPLEVELTHAAEAGAPPLTPTLLKSLSALRAL